MGFRQDLKLGKQAERAVKNLFENSGFVINEVDSGANPGYDMEISFVGEKCSVKATAEVKLDRLAETTSNFCLEYFNPKTNKPSGINITSSLLYVYVIPDGSNLPVWVTSVKLLKRYIRENTPFKDLKRVGDGNASIYLYKLDDILKIFKRIDNIPHKDIPLIIKNILKGKL